jgi:hypothetical protein
MEIILTIRVRQRFFQRKQLSAGIICRSARDLAAVWLSVTKNQSVAKIQEEALFAI